MILTETGRMPKNIKVAPAKAKIMPAVNCIVFMVFFSILSMKLMIFTFIKASNNIKHNFFDACQYATILY